MIRDRGRYSRWALAAAGSAGIAVADFVAISLVGMRGLDRSPQFVGPCIVVGLIAGGPAALVLAKVAMREITRMPYLRGRLLAETVIIIGWASIVIEVGLAVLYGALLMSGAFYAT